MLNINGDHLTDSDLAYVAFRLAFFETLERISLADQMGLVGEGALGYLSEVPFLRNVAPQVQLDLLVDCWSKVCSQESHRASLVDESVVYAVCESSARIVDADAEFATHFLASGPRVQPAGLVRSLPDHLRFLHLSLPNEGHFLLISQFQDVAPDEGERLKSNFGMTPSECEPMFDVLGRWHVSPAFRHNAEGLLLAAEVTQAAQVLGLDRTTSSQTT
ncbi:MAG: hypothetical protein KDA52_02620 [Planctomycetaceae bacterium]|nr:hypothetical protein [Planctomycetaceae bacterium]